MSVTQEEREVLERLFRKYSVYQLQLEEFSAAAASSNEHTLELDEYKYLGRNIYRLGERIRVVSAAFLCN